MRQSQTNDEFFKIQKHIATLYESETGQYTKELNLVSWKGKPAVLDLRRWDNGTDGQGEKKAQKGISFNRLELPELLTAMQSVTMEDFKGI